MRRSAALWVLFMALFSIPTQGRVLCKRGPDSAVVLPKFNSAEDKCTGSAIIQAFQYKCGKKEDVASNTQAFLINLRETGRKTCEEHCKERAFGCEGTFIEPSSCGFSVKPPRSPEVGEFIAECGNDCEGTAFSYCSIYHASYTSIDEKFFKKSTPNCFCQWKDRKKSK